MIDSIQCLLKFTRIYFLKRLDFIRVFKANSFPSTRIKLYTLQIDKYMGFYTQNEIISPGTKFRLKNYSELMINVIRCLLKFPRIYFVKRLDFILIFKANSFPSTRIKPYTPRIDK